MPERNSGNHPGAPTSENPKPEKSVAKSVAATGFPRRAAATNQLLAPGKSHSSTLDEAATVEQGSQLVPSQGQVRFDPFGTVRSTSSGVRANRI
jgi:hypothetical protein